MVKLIMGNMGSGKSAYLIDEIKKAINDYGSFKVLVCKPKVDTRSGDFIKSRNGQYISAITIDSFFEILQYAQELPIKKIFIDEVQFLNSRGMRRLYILCKQRDIDIVASGLDLTSELRPFETTSTFMCYCDVIDVIGGICEVCGEKSRLSDYKGIKKSDIEVGEGKYFGTCEKCHSYINEGSK